MATSESDLVKRIREAPINYALLKLIHHEFGNGLAVLSGYRHLLQQRNFHAGARTLPPTWDVWQDRNERWLGYLRTMHDREMRLNNLLVQLRELSPGATDEPLCQHFVRTDLVVLLGRVIEQRVLLCPDCVSQVSMPAQSLFIMCDPFWMQVLFEHVLSTIQSESEDILILMPAEIHLEPFPNPMGREAKITLRLRSDLPRRTPGREGEFEAQATGNLNRASWKLVLRCVMRFCTNMEDRSGVRARRESFSCLATSGREKREGVNSTILLLTCMGSATSRLSALPESLTRLRNSSSLYCTASHPKCGWARIYTLCVQQAASSADSL